MKTLDELWDEWTRQTLLLKAQQSDAFAVLKEMVDAVLQEKVSDLDEVDEILLELAVFGDHYAPARDLFREVSLKIIHRQPPFCALESVWVKSIREAAIQMSEGENHL